MIEKEDAYNCVGSGWNSLINKVYDKKPKKVVIMDVKEKWGALRIYSFPSDAYFEGFLYDIESESQKICEVCGREGVTRPMDGWWKTLCFRCARGF